MGVDYYTCENCGETFPDCGTYAKCEHGHHIGPCCFPKVHGKYLRAWPEDQTIEDHPDYGHCVKEAHCPVCAKGGNDAQKLRKSESDLSAAVKRAEDAERELHHARAHLAVRLSCYQCTGRTRTRREAAEGMTAAAEPNRVCEHCGRPYRRSSASHSVTRWKKKQVSACSLACYESMRQAKGLTLEPYRATSAIPKG